MLSGDLADHFAETGRWRQAVEHHLIYATWQYSCWDKAEPFPDYNAEFHYPSKRIRRKKARSDIHRISVRLLRDQSNTEVVRAVFVPFYRSFWRNVLLDGELNAELVDAATLLLRCEPKG